MLPNSPDLLLRLIKSNTSFLLYGQKASGKTKLIHRLLDKAQARFIEINCTLTSKKQNFLWLFNVELRKYLKSKGVEMEPLGQPVNLDSWISELKRLVN
jgi:MoxR-like ATPase